MTAPVLDIPAAAALIARGGVVAYPTEGVWGLGCDPFDRDAVTRLLDIKQRPVDKGVILIAGALAQLDAIVDWTRLSDDARTRVTDSWPGPNTWVVPARADVPAWITGVHASVAVRVSAHADVVALCAAFGGALVSTSANLTGEPAVADRDALDVRLLARIDGMLDGRTGGREGPSTIRDARTGNVFRA
ncbi:Sua5/YciO/YrdC/YwlC family protein [Luteimonas fraxinea]|uniref:Threonylcarbamoyl-AMP synthase n=1 Tax=Luteimonas fraxinea TaxID=2901869 RepID=A0ABS8UH80_9GAMM|nr:Sua5/YciO/YrdC/YwlC family protein [Luteimonas fraxinea]MCD9098873.1 Sua5/YciO/YrdC/YwlC family protein [Luteimonas fraxinea]MCD9125263.1 Sua5/YciO/YrdC/YwlC family protein [Luteimonas fraxinea]UHH09069.1 Sua5/YciO/YrdC/YwlC family protein [Luteimonas fraxinea]